MTPRTKGDALYRAQVARAALARKAKAAKEAEAKRIANGELDLSTRAKQLEDKAHALRAEAMILYEAHRRIQAARKP